MKKLTKLGIGLTGLWVFVSVITIVLNSKSARTMTLNEWGDFIAGASSLLALLWLVIGYFQHGEELRLNTAALGLQKEELSNQVRETARLAGNAQRQAEAAERLTQLTKQMQDRERRREAWEAEPELVGSGGSSGAQFETTIKNRRGEARELECQYSGPHLVKLFPPKIWERNASARLIVWPKGQLSFPIQFQITCTDSIGTRHRMAFELSESHDLLKTRHERQTENRCVIGICCQPRRF